MSIVVFFIQAGAKLANPEEPEVQTGPRNFQVDGLHVPERFSPKGCSQQDGKGSYLAI